MSSVTMMSEDNKRSKGRGTSTVVEEVSSGRSSSLKKGPWTSAEDAILVEYVNKHGEGNWNAVQKNSGLSRCGKSCRLRWANHLRPDLKKGAFTPEEERRIIELHAKWGNKWARMASELPGRTDNEIKNYWNTRIKRLLRAGLPVYPPDVNQVHAESEESQNMGTLQSGGSDGPDLIHNHHLAYPEVGSRAFDFSQNVLPYSSDFPSTPASNMLETGCSPSGYSFVIPGMHTPRHLRELETGFPDLDGSVRSGLPALTRWMDYTSGILTEPFPLSYPYDSNLNPYCEPPMGVFSGSHALLNGNSSSSQSLQGAMKLELPSLQYAETRQDSWDTSGSPLPSLESVDTFTLSPLAEKKQEDSLSPHKSGLLEAVLYESKTLKNRKRNRGSQASDDLVAPGDAAESLSTTPYDTDWGTHADLISPLGYSAASVFSDSTPTSKTLPDEPAVIKTEVATPYLEANEVPDLMDVSRPDVLLGSCWF